MSDALEKEIWGAEQQGTPTPRTVDELVRDWRPFAHSKNAEYAFDVMSNKARQLERELIATEQRAVAWAESKGKILAMYENTQAELSAKTAEAERLREALKPKIMPSVGVAIGTRLRDFYRNRFALVNPVQHTDNERQVILAALESLLAALAATRKEEGNG